MHSTRAVNILRLVLGVRLVDLMRMPCHRERQGRAVRGRDKQEGLEIRNCHSTLEMKLNRRRDASQERSRAYRVTGRSLNSRPGSRFQAGSLLHPAPRSSQTSRPQRAPHSSEMPRKTAAAADGDAAAPRRSTRIKDQPKPAPAKPKAPAKPRAKKASTSKKDVEEKPEASKKRAAEDEPEGAEKPVSKKVRSVS